MPHFEDPTKHGELYVEYHVVLPASLGDDQKRSKLGRITWRPQAESIINRVGRCLP